MKLCLEELNGELTDDDRQTFEKYKAEEERAIYLLKCKKKKMLERPTFLLLIANANNKIVKNFSTYIETADEAKYFSKGTIKKILIDNKVNLVLGCYTGVIVRKSFYDKMSDFPIIKAFSILIFFLSNYMQYIKANLIQIIFMLIAFGLLLYGYLKDEALYMAVSSLLAMLVWLIDSIVNTNKMKNFDDRLKNEEEWYEGA